MSVMSDPSHGRIASLARDRKQLVELAGVAEQAERYQDMAECMKTVVQMGGDLSLEERNLFALAYKNLVMTKRSGWKTLTDIEQKVDGFSSQLARQYRERVATEIKTVCNEVLDLVQKYLEPQATQAETRVFYTKMTGDYNRYLAMNCDVTDGQQKQYSDAAKAAYDKALLMSRTDLPPTHRTRLALALNFAIFFYEILNDRKRAIQIAQAAVEEAISDAAPDSLSEEHKRDSSFILSLLMDNCTLWAASNEDAVE